MFGPVGMFGTLGWQELLIFMVIVLLLFGANRLPSLMRNMGRSINEFKAGMTEKPTKHAIEEGKDATEP